MKIEKWLDYQIRFVEKNGEWWAVLKDVTDALGLRTDAVKTRLEKDMVSNHIVDVTPFETASHKARNTQEMIVVNEFGIYETIFSSRKPEAKEFKQWVFKVIRELRKESGLDGFQVFRLLDKEHQKEMMKNLSKSLKKPVRVDFIKANIITNKAVSNKHGYSKMIHKNDMTPQMLIERQEILEDTVDLMSVNDKFELGLSISSTLYKKYS